MNPKVSIELDTSQWWAAVSCLRGEDVGDMPELAAYLVRSITKPCTTPSVEEVMEEATEVMGENEEVVFNELLELEAL